MSRAKKPILASQIIQATIRDFTENPAAWVQDTWTDQEGEDSFVADEFNSHWIDLFRDGFYDKTLFPVVDPPSVLLDTV